MGLFGIDSTTEHITAKRGSKPTNVDQAQWDANPYASYDYKHTWWQQFLESLGIRTNYDAFKESMAVNAAEYDAQLAEKAHNEEYESPIEQVQRMRAAGINPDLSGDIGTGDSSPMEPDPNAPIAPSETDFNKVSGFFNGVMGAISAAIGFAKDGLALSQMRNAVDSGKIDNAKALFGLAGDTASNFIPSMYDENDPAWMNRAAGLANDIMSPLIPRSMQKNFRNALGTFYSSAPKTAEQWKLWRENVAGKQGFFMDTSSEFWKDGSDEVLRDVANEFVKVTDKIKWQLPKTELAQQGLGEIEANKQSQYFQTLDPSLGAQVENITNQRNLASRNIDKILDTALNEIIVDLKDRSESGKRGHALASSAIIFLSFLRMTNFSASRGSLGGVKSSKFSFGF